MHPINKIRIDLQAVEHNFRQAQSLLTSNTYIAPVIKGDAYGHGMVEVANRLRPLGITQFAVSNVHEGKILRDAGFNEPILVLLGVLPHEMETLIVNRLTPVIFDQKTARELNKKVFMNRPLPVHIKVDTGMGRLGIPVDQAMTAIKQIACLENLYIEGVMTHLATANDQHSEFTKTQITRFKRLISDMKRAGIVPRYLHLANSAAMIGQKTDLFNMVRPGIMLYGSYPSDTLVKRVCLRPTMTFHSRLIQVKDLPKGHPIGYGCTHRLSKKTRVGIVPVGYDDGYSRAFSNKGVMLVNSQRCPVIGRVSMHITALDLTKAKDAKCGDDVVILGRQGDAVISAEEMAKSIDTITYEIFCNLGKSNHREYIT